MCLGGIYLTPMVGGLKHVSSAKDTRLSLAKVFSSRNNILYKHLLTVLCGKILPKKKI